MNDVSSPTSLEKSGHFYHRGRDTTRLEAFVDAALAVIMPTYGVASGRRFRARFPSVLTER